MSDESWNNDSEKYRMRAGVAVETTGNVVANGKTYVAQKKGHTIPK